MSTTPTSRLADIVGRNQEELLQEWLHAQQAASSRRTALIGAVDLEQESRELLSLMQRALADGDGRDIDGPRWEPVRDFLSGLSRTRAEAGFSPSETAMFVFSLKQPLLGRLASEYADDAQGLIAVMWETTALLDKLGLLTTEEYQKGRESVIHRQQRELIELSTPVVKLWDGVLAVPLIGTLDSERTQTVMESLLERIVDTNSTIAIIDITGVPTVDTLVAQHLLKTVAAARLMGADCVISGIRPQIAQTIVHLGLTLSEVTTKATMADAIAHALDRQGMRIAPVTDRVAMPETERIPILKMGDLLLVTIQIDMHDRIAMRLQDDLTERVVKDHARGVLIDISSLEIVDSFIGRVLANIAAMSRVLDAETVVVGMRPAVAITLVELGLSLPDVRTALNVEQGMQLLARQDGTNRWSGRDHSPL